MNIADRLSELGIQLPKAASPVASYMPLVEQDNIVHVSGQLPFVDGQIVKGRLGENVSLKEGQAAARACGLMILAQLHNADLIDRVARVVKLGAFIASSNDFTDQPMVANGASDLMFEVFGEQGRHARAAVGVPVLPLGAAVEVDAIVALSQ